MVMHCTVKYRAVLVCGSVYVLRRGCSAVHGRVHVQVCRSAWKHADLSICCSTAQVCMALALLYLEDKTAASCVEERRCARPCAGDSKPKG